MKDFLGFMFAGLMISLFIKYWFVFAIFFGFFLALKIFGFLYREINPDAKKSYLEKKAKEDRENNERINAEAEKARKIKEQEKAEKRRKELERTQHRDADQHVLPYVYKIGKHGNESLAIRYGIANQTRSIEEYWYYAKGGERKRNPERDKVFYKPSDTIRIQKTNRLSKDLYEVLLSDFRDRKARAVIEKGSEYVKTFYPLNDDWFDEYSDLETTLKGNNSFTLKELATFHVQKAVNNKKN